MIFLFNFFMLIFSLIMIKDILCPIIHDKVIDVLRCIKININNEYAVQNLVLIMVYYRMVFGYHVYQK